jgi:hypothetical protein
VSVGRTIGFIGKVRTVRELICSLVALMYTFDARGLTITFDTPPASGPVGIDEYRSDGYIFRNADPTDEGGPLSSQIGHRTSGASPSWLFPGNGTSYLHFLSGQPLEFFREDGDGFTLVSVDLAEYSSVFRRPEEITIVGQKSDGTTVSQTFITDGVNDGGGVLVDFETFHLSGDFNDLVAVRIPRDIYALDNVVIPEPSTAALLALGLVGIAAGHRRTAARSR